MESEIAAQADFSVIRYGQCWEDADILLDAMNIRSNHVCLSVASAGDNTLAIVARGPRRVIALDLNPAQLACLELRVAAYQRLGHKEVLELLGARTSTQRAVLYRHCRPQLSVPVRDFWDERSHKIDQGIANAGKFERYLRIFGRYILPLIHSGATRRDLLTPRTAPERLRFYEEVWDNRRWRLLFQIFFSRRIMGLLGRSPSFFTYVDEDVPAQIFAQTRHALTVLDPSQNPYLQWILWGGHHGRALPFALRPENFVAIRDNLDALEWHLASVESYLNTNQVEPFDGLNLSDIFEYMSPENYAVALEQLAAHARPCARLVYWNMMVPRHRPESLAHQLTPLSTLAAELHARDKAFFYRDFVVEEVRD